MPPRLFWAFGSPPDILFRVPLIADANKIRKIE